MSENTEKKITEVDVYKEGVIIDIKLPVAFVTRFNQLLLEGIPFKDVEHVAEVMGKVAKGDQDDPFAYHVTTLISFLSLVEDAAKEQGHLKKIKINSEGNIEEEPADSKESV